MKLLVLLSALAALAPAAPAADANAIPQDYSSQAPQEYQPCGGLSGLQCPEGQTCVDNPRSCSQAVDCTGICVTPRFCGGFANIQCPSGYQCVEDPRDDCDPNNGGADCGGLCA